MIPEERITSYLEMLLTKSEPGASLHQLVTIAAGPDAISPDGAIDPEKTQTSVYAIAPTGDIDPEQFCATVIAHAATEHIKRGEAILWAGLAQEMVAVVDPTPQASAMMRQHRLQEHPDACEVTIIYAACADGRRWTGRRWLTGSDAGKTEDLHMLVGTPTLHESHLLTSPLVRKLVGIGD